MPTSRTAPIRQNVQSGSFVAIALVVQGITTYAFNLFASRWLGPEAYGAVAALLNILLVLAVVAMGLQATGARRIAAGIGSVDAIATALVRTSRRAGAALAIGVMLLSPVVATLLNLDSIWPVVLLGCSLYPLTLAGGQGGTLQGKELWFSLSSMYFSLGFGRLLAGLVTMQLWPTVTGAMLGVAVGAWAPAIAGGLAVRKHLGPTGDGLLELARESIANAHAFFAFFALMSADLVVARNALSETDAGLYAGGVLLAKAVLFLPQFVVVVAFPKMATATSSKIYLTALAVVGLMGSTVVFGIFVLPEFGLAFVGGEAYRDVSGLLVRFAVLGTVLSMIQLLVYQVVARQHGSLGPLVIWTGTIAVLAAGLVVSSPQGLLWWVICVDVVALSALIIAASRRMNA